MKAFEYCTASHRRRLPILASKSENYRLYYFVPFNFGVDLFLSVLQIFKKA